MSKSKNNISNECLTQPQSTKKNSGYLEYMFNYIDNASDEQITADLLGMSLEQFRYEKDLRERAMKLAKELN